MAHKTIKLITIENIDERNVLELLNNKSKCFYGEIIKELALSVDQGQRIIQSMKSKGLIANNNDSLVLELNVDIQ